MQAENQQAQKRHKELDGLVKKLYEGNATGKIPDKHFTRLLNEYDEEQTGLETSIAEWQRQIENWNADRLKTDQFIQLVKRYTDFSELTTPMLNGFIEKVVVHEGEGRGNDRRQRIDIYLNFIGAFEVPDYIVTPAEVEEQRRQQEEQAAKALSALRQTKGKKGSKLPYTIPLRKLRLLPLSEALLRFVNICVQTKAKVRLLSAHKVYEYVPLPCWQNVGVAYG